MSSMEYLTKIQAIIETIKKKELKNLQAAGRIMARSVERGGRIYAYGTGHSVIPVLDLYPRYGSFVGFYPLYDPRLMWFNVIGPGGARELLWLERREGYAKIFLESYGLERRDCSDRLLPRRLEFCGDRGRHRGEGQGAQSDHGFLPRQP